eukprot:CAMPEP_0204830388 /NCGR_PEP_ID=MMETSP1346-20131115/8510_1 /ASSEMBLY_ACC=CAM_ASM_000771 /TAXON_ID=215587 /ORGANISM="Aplanochytrium stocchinoi, Strain GSBS06" /LENGTH=312 /DNA_ID=CAMNT_0051960585 /DNA_START=64 /DNA_END=999 /DNA_ORIENTATION=+
MSLDNNKDQEEYTDLDGTKNSTIPNLDQSSKAGYNDSDEEQEQGYEEQRVKQEKVLEEFMKVENPFHKDSRLTVNEKENENSEEYTDLDGTKTSTVPNPDQSRKTGYYFILLANLTLWSICGCVIRVAFENTALSSSIHTYLWPQFLGTMVISYMAIHKERIENRFAPEIYTGIATGFCGSLTTFSSWMIAPVALAFNINESVYPAGALSNSDVAYLWFELFFVGLAFPILGWGFGVHLADIEMNVFACEWCEGKRLFTWKQICLDVMVVVFACLIMIMLLLLAIYVDTDFPVIALLFAPFGATLRWALGKW